MIDIFKKLNLLEKEELKKVNIQILKEKIANSSNPVEKDKYIIKLQKLEYNPMNLVLSKKENYKLILEPVEIKKLKVFHKINLEINESSTKIAKIPLNNITKIDTNSYELKKFENKNKFIIDFAITNEIKKIKII
ncbi:MAG TPA: hypothetical protein PLI27_06265 [Ignavibacteriales bacterium]|nr:hypothetical protein [Ignavibacteriales bacterium]HOL80882.1 hypothetical protein [Ignavibacteriales bacterium]HPD67662.1 hypothetical protein [Ignavibacteriales bacterium]HPP33317.1 hypothetical protein [Ignavibacteriales bacterium]HRR17991.1 hypothetical protein [Ignavibacteriales bacterium]